MMFVTAIEHSGVLGEGFQSVAFPATNESARFPIRWLSCMYTIGISTHHPYTATGKLKAVITATAPMDLELLRHKRILDCIYSIKLAFQDQMAWPFGCYDLSVSSFETGQRRSHTTET